MQINTRWQPARVQGARRPEEAAGGGGGLRWLRAPVTSWRPTPSPHAHTTSMLRSARAVPQTLRRPFTSSATALPWALYSYWRSSCSYRVRIVLAHKGLLASTEIRPVHLVKDGVRSMVPSTASRAHIPSQPWWARQLQRSWLSVQLTDSCGT
jgi:hypothetical protein